MSQNQNIEKAAMKAANFYEKNRVGVFPRKAKRSEGFDLESKDRKIEVKGTKLPWNEFQHSYHIVSDNERRHATYLYLFCNVLDEPDPHVFEMSKVHKALEPEVRYRLEFSLCANDEEEETRKEGRD